MDLLNRESKRDQRDIDKVDNYKINSISSAIIEPFAAKILEVFKQDQEGDCPFPVVRKLRYLYEGNEIGLSMIVVHTILNHAICPRTQKSSAGVEIFTSSKVFPLTRIASALGTSIITDRTMDQLKDADVIKMDRYISKEYQREPWKILKAKRRSIENIKGALDIGSKSYVTKIGVFLVSLLSEMDVDVVEIDTISNETRREYRGHKHNIKLSSRIVYISDEMTDVICDLGYEAELKNIIKPTVPVMTEKPQRLYTIHDEGHQLLKDGRNSQVVKSPNKSNIRDFKSEVFDSTGQWMDIQSKIEGTTWTINTKVLDVIKEIFEGNIIDKDRVIQAYTNCPYSPNLIGGLPLRYGIDEDAVLPKSEFGRTYLNSKGREMFYMDTPEDKESLNKYNRVKNDLLHFKDKNLNKALSLIFLMNAATTYKDLPHFFFTYFYDFRGRIYPVQQGLNPQSDDIGKAMLAFKAREALTDSGYYWFKIHGANTFGKDKLPYEERIEFMEGYVDNVLLIAEDPVRNHKLWADAGEPFSFLAFCFEYAEVLKDREYKTNIAAAMDATCSGTQVYAAAMHDEEGAKAVNVIGTSREDIYQKVANQVIADFKRGDYPETFKFKKSDGGEGDFALKPIVDSLIPHIDRSLTKRNTMTQPYSVTLRGMVAQLAGTFRDIEEAGDKYWVGEIWQVSKVMAYANLKAINKICVGAKKGKEFITHICKGVSSATDNAIIWKNPVGFKVYQKACKQVGSTYRGHITKDGQIKEINFSLHTAGTKLDKRAQVSSIAPNLIHSLDSGILHLTVDKCYNQGVRDFALIHDSFGVHPNNVDILHKAYRDAFIETFSGDILMEWALEVMDNAKLPYAAKAEIINSLPDHHMIGTLNIEDIEHSRYIIS